MTQSFILMALGIGIGVDRAAYRLAMQSALGADFVTTCKGSRTAAQCAAYWTLVPDIVAAILDETLPPEVTLFELGVDPPALWEGQRNRVEGLITNWILLGS